MLCVHRYEVPIKDSFILSLPRTGKFLAFQSQRGLPQIWMLADPEDNRRIDCEFLLVGTGHLIEEPEGNLHYRGACQMREGALLRHLFEVIRF